MKTLCLAALVCAVPIALVSARSLAQETGAKPAAGAVSYEVDPVHSTVVFRVKHMGVSYFYGRFNEVKGSVSYDAAKPEASTVSLEIPVESIDTGNKQRDGHLLSPDFFSGKEFASITYASKSIKKSSKAGFLDVEGELKLHGVAKPVKAEVEIVGASDTKMGPRAGFDVAFELKRSDFGMDKMLDALGDEVTVRAGIECTRK